MYLWLENFWKDIQSIVVVSGERETIFSFFVYLCILIILQLNLVLYIHWKIKVGRARRKEKRVATVRLPNSSLPQLYWGILTNKNCVYLKCTAWCFDTYYEITTTIKLINISITSHSYHFCGVYCVYELRTLKTHALRESEVCNTVLRTLSHCCPLGPQSLLIS